MYDSRHDRERSDRRDPEQQESNEFHRVPLMPQAPNRFQWEPEGHVFPGCQGCVRLLDLLLIRRF